MPTEESQLPTPQLVIELKGGLVWRCTANVPLDVLTLDYDQPDDATPLIEEPGEDSRRAYVWVENVRQDPDKVARLFDKHGS